MSEFHNVALNKLAEQNIALTDALRECVTALSKACEWYEGKHEYAVDLFEDIEKQTKEALTRAQNLLKEIKES